MPAQQKPGPKAGPVRIAVAALALSAAGLIGIATKEGYTDRAIIPTKGDRPTVGFGSTVREDGSRVQMGDRTDPVRALRTVKAHLDREENQFRESLAGVALTQVEYDVYMDFTYQYGLANWRGSTMRKQLLAGNYAEACDALLMWRKAGGYDCSTLVDGRPNKRCWGVWERQLERVAACRAELQ